MADIANGLKHFQLSTPKSKIKSVESYGGSFDYTFDFTFEKPHIRIKFDDGEWLDLVMLIDTVFEFWSEFLDVQEK